MRMLTVIAAAAAAFATVPAVAETDDTLSFKHEGLTYVYTVTEKGTTQYINGHTYPGGGEFSLRVRGDRVDGTSNGWPVRFSVAAAKGAINRSGAEVITMR